MDLLDTYLPVTTTAAGAMALTALAVALTPGPNVVYLTSHSISQGRRAGLVSLAGAALGFVVCMLMANLGLAVVFIAVPWLFIGFKAAGVVYLACAALRPGGHAAFETHDLRSPTLPALSRPRRG